MTPETLLLAIPAGLLLMLIGAAGIVGLRCINAGPDPHMPPPSSPEDQQMHEAYDRYWDALDECALNGDTKKYDEIRKMGWRRFGLTPSR